MIADVIEYLGFEIQNEIYDKCYEVLLLYVLNEHPTLRHVAAYGIGMASKQTP